MSSKIMITYKRKRVTSHAHTADETILDSSSAASRNVLVSNPVPTFEAHAENITINEDSFATPTNQQRFCTYMQQNIKEECEPDKGQNQLFESLPQKEQPDICCATILSTAEAHINKLQCTDDTNDQIHVSSSVCDLMLADGATDQTKESNSSTLAEINSHQGLENVIIPGQCKRRFSPLLTFRRRLKKKINLDEPAEEICSPDNDKQCSTLTSSPPRSSINATPLLKYTSGNPLDIEDKVAIVRSTGLSTQAEHLPEQKNSQIVGTLVQHIVPQAAEVVNQNTTLEDDATPVSKFTGVQEAHEQDARVEHSGKTLPTTIEVPKVINLQGEGHNIGQTSSLESPRQKVNVSWLVPTNKSVAEDILESQGSTKNVPIIMLDDDSDERGKGLENLEALNQGFHNQDERSLLGKIDLNRAEVQQGLLHLDDSSIQRSPGQDLVDNARKQMSKPIERMFFRKEKDTIHGKLQRLEESSTMNTSYSNFFDLTPPWNTGSLKGPRSLPSELKFRVMDRAPEFSLDLSLDSFADNSVSAQRSDNLFLGGTSSVSHKLTEKLGTYSYKRHSAPWSEEELDLLWIGVRRYGINNWDAMLKDTRLRFSNSRMPEDLAKQWDKEQKKLLASALAPAPHFRIAEDYLGRASCSGCSKSPILAARTDLSLGDVYLRNACASGRGQHHLSSLGMLNLHGAESGPRNLSLGGASSYGRNASRRRRASKLHKSYYDQSPLWFQESSGKVPQQLFPMNQQPMNSLPLWLTKDAETGTSRMDPETWPSTSVAAPPGHCGADPLKDGLRASASLYSQDVKPHALADASLKRAMRRNADWRSFSKRLFGSGDALDLNQGVAAAPASDTGASSEETVSDS